MNPRAAIAFALALAAVPAVAQQIYRWTDDKGRVHISDTPPPASAKSVRKIGPAGGGEAGGEAGSGQMPYELAQVVKSFPVTLYTSPSCKEPCTSARSALNQRGVPFKEVQVWDETTNEELRRASGRNDVPTLVVGRSVHVGFEQSAFDALLDSARYPKAGSIPARAQAAPPPPEGYAPPQVPVEPVPPEPEAPAPAGPYAPKPPPPGRQ